MLDSRGPRGSSTRDSIPCEPFSPKPVCVQVECLELELTLRNDRSAPVATFDAFYCAPNIPYCCLSAFTLSGKWEVTHFDCDGAALRFRVNHSGRAKQLSQDQLLSLPAL